MKEGCDALKHVLKMAHFNAETREDNEGWWYAWATVDGDDTPCMFSVEPTEYQALVTLVFEHVVSE